MLRRSERISAPLRCTISAFSFNTNTTARRDDTTHNGSKLALSKRLLATRCSPPVPRAYRRHYNALGRRFELTLTGDEDSVAGDSFSRGLLDFPHFTRPAEFRDLKVPDVLVSGHHGEIRKWRKRQALELTLDRRPELLADAELDVEEQEILRELMEKKGVAHGRD